MATSSKASVAAALLLCLHGWIALHSLSQKSLTFDETSHLPAGLALVATGEIHINRQHPPLVKQLAGLAALTADPVLPLDGAAYRQAEEWEFGRQVLFHPENDRRALLHRGRLPIVGFSILAGLVVFLWTRRRSGDAGALFALTLWTFSPSMLAHARWVTMDMAVTATGLLCLFLFWRLCDAAPAGPVPLPRALGFGIALGFALGAKFSGLVLIPAMILADLLCRRPHELKTWLLYRARLWLTASIAAWLVLWTLYLFPADPFVYFRDVAQIYASLKPDYLFYLAGTFQSEGFPHYFLATYALKSTPVELLSTLAVLAVAASRVWRRDPALKPDLFLIVPAGAWFTATTLMASSQGHRYILMLYPLVFILAGTLVPTSLGRLPGRTALALWLALGLGQALETALHHPDYIPYFNRLAGGPTAGPLWLDDSNVDWSQDAGRLGPWLAAKGIDSVRLGLQRNAAPHLPGIRHEPLHLTDWRDGPEPGAYVISGHVLARGLEMKQLHGYQSDWLHRYEPVDVLGGSLYLYIFE